MTNSTAAVITVEDDGDYIMAWDEVGRANAEFIALANPANIRALVEALEKSDSRLHEVAVACATAEQALEKAQETIAFQQGEVKALLSSLESRTVKMPEPFKLAKSSSGLTYYFADDVDAALTAAGIKWEAE
ncbi:hypothetical protein [Klebsiella michiganensis]|uniref:hypothetical protein n=1 Tax=Klebsiella michiganensis TaxID=1134687 RepID=UPI001CC93DE3|nr:hypothetical protein [Klebsiella michiganensis]